MGIPTGLSYPKMVTGTDALGRTVPLVFPAGDPKQFAYVILANQAAEQAYTGNGVLPVSILPSGNPTNSPGNSWENRHHG